MIFKKLLEIQKLNIVVTKDSINPHFKNKYTSLDKIIETYRPILSSNWLLVTHTSYWSMLTTRIIDIEDDSEVTTSFNLSWATPQQVWSAITYAKRYNLWQLLDITTDEDDDWNKASQPKKIEEKKEFTQDKLDALIVWSEGKEKWEIMQQALKIKKDYTINKEVSDNIDLFLSQIK